MKQIILARHTETELIASGNNGASRNDSPLTEFGKTQAREMREFLESKNYNFEIVFTSLFQRAANVGGIINETRSAPLKLSASFNEYFNRDDGTGVEGVEDGSSRTMSKIYSIHDIFDEILIVGHASINKTILQSLTNMQYADTKNYFNKLGEVHILRYDYKKGDANWTVVDSFTPNQPSN